MFTLYPLDIKDMGIKVEIVGGYSLIFRADDSEEVSKKLDILSRINPGDS